MDGLLQCVLADQPGAALVLADRCEERGQLRAAELLRLHDRLGQLPPYGGVTLEGGHALRVGTADVLVTGAPLFEPEYEPPTSTAVTVQGWVPADELPQPPAWPATFALLSADLAVRLRFGGREAPLAVPEYDRVRSGPPGLLRVLFTLCPVVVGDRVSYFEPYTDPDEPERLALKRRGRVLRAALGIPAEARALAEVARWLATTS